MVCFMDYNIANDVAAPSVRRLCKTGSVAKRGKRKIKHTSSLLASSLHTSQVVELPVCEAAYPSHPFLPEATLPEDLRTEWRRQELTDLYHHLIVAVFLLQRNYILQRKIDDAQREAHRIVAICNKSQNLDCRINDGGVVFDSSEPVSSTAKEINEE